MKHRIGSSRAIGNRAPCRHPERHDIENVRIGRKVGIVKRGLEGIATVVVLCLVSVLGLSQAALGDDPPFVGWTEIAPSLTPGHEPDDPNICKKGHENCVHSVIREMDRRFGELLETCDHDALFALTYLRTTEEYHRFWHEEPFDDQGWLNHYDAVFADYYFRAIDAWQKGRHDEVPPAWRVAFQASDDRAVSGSGSLYLGMSAHINRDLPFVLYELGLVAPDGTSRKADHDRVNEFLNRVSDELFPELARRLDPTVDDTNIEGTTIDDFATFQIIPTWREAAWRNAELLANAPTEEARELVAQEIETAAYLEAVAIREATAYQEPLFGLLDLWDADDRDAYCFENRYS